MSEIDDLRADNARLKAWVADLLEGHSVNCVYCGYNYGPSSSTPVTMAEVLKRHIASCPEHPMSDLLKSCKLAYHTLSSMHATREGIPDERLAEYIQTIKQSVIKAQGDSHGL